MSNLKFDQRGSTWTCSYAAAGFPLMLIARRVYYGTGRLLTTLTLARLVDETKPSTAQTVLTEHVDLLTGSRRKAFSKEASSRLNGSDQVSREGYETGITVMIDALLERLLTSQNEIEIEAADTIEIPKDLTPPYAIWPLVPSSRPGMLVAPSGSGKSGLAVVAGLSVCLGRVLIERIEPRVQGSVLYVGQEETKEQWAARLEMICRGLNIERPSNYFYVKLRGGSLLESAEILGEQAASRKSALVIIDSAQATWGNGDSDAIREYASRWYSSIIEQVRVPTLVVEHPNAASTGNHKNGKELFAAGTSVKRDRVGHAWSLKSVQLPTPDDEPIRYHVTLTDEKRNYVARQQNITYETVVSGYDWMRFETAEALTAETIVQSASRLDGSIARIMRNPDDQHEGFGYTVAELAALLKSKDDRRIRQSLVAEVWRPSDWEPKLKFRFQKVPGSGSSRLTNPTRFQLETKDALAEDPEQTEWIDVD